MPDISEKLLQAGLIRKAGMSEQGVIARSFNGFYNNFALFGIYNRKLTSSLVYQVLKKMILKYSYLTVNYDKNTNKIYPVSKIYFDDVYESRKQDNLNYERLFEEIEYYKFPLNSGKPLFKLLHINNTILAVIFDHAVVDGISGSNFHSIFLEILNSLTEDELNWNYSSSSDSLLFDLVEGLEELDSFPLPTEEYLNYVPDTLVSCKRVIKGYLPHSLRQAVNDHQYSDPPLVPGKLCLKWPGIQGKTNFKTAFKCINIPPEIVSSAVKLCRSKNVTLTPLLEVIMCQTLCSLGIIKDSSQEKDCYFIKSMLPSDLRRFLDPDMGHRSKLGLRVFPGIFNYPLVDELLKSGKDDDIFWKIVQRSHKTISLSSSDPKSIVDQWYSLNASYDENSLSKMVEANLEGFKKGSGPTTRLSNLGLFRNSYNESANFKLENAYFTQSLGVNGGCVVANIVSTEKGGMNITCACMEEQFNGKTGLNGFASTFERNILRYIDASV